MSHDDVSAMDLSAYKIMIESEIDTQSKSITEPVPRSESHPIKVVDVDELLDQAKYSIALDIEREEAEQFPDDIDEDYLSLLKAEGIDVNNRTSLSDYIITAFKAEQSFSQKSQSATQTKYYPQVNINRPSPIEVKPPEYERAYNPDYSTKSKSKFYEPPSKFYEPPSKFYEPKVPYQEPEIVYRGSKIPYQDSGFTSFDSARDGYESKSQSQHTRPVYDFDGEDEVYDFEDIANELASLRGVINNLSANVLSVKESVSMGDLAEVHDNIGTLEGEMDVLNTRIKDVSDTLGSTNVKLDQLDAKLDGLSQKCVNHFGAVAVLIKMQDTTLKHILDVLRLKKPDDGTEMFGILG